MYKYHFYRMIRTLLVFFFLYKKNNADAQYKKLIKIAYTEWVKIGVVHF